MISYVRGIYNTGKKQIKMMSVKLSKRLPHLATSNKETSVDVSLYIFQMQVFVGILRHSKKNWTVVAMELRVSLVLSFPLLLGNSKGICNFRNDGSSVLFDLILC